MWSAFEAAKRAGKAKHIGVSNFNAHDLTLLATTAVEPIEVLEVRQLRHHLGPFRAFLGSAPSHTRRVLCSTWCPCRLVLIGAWKSDVVAKFGAFQAHFGVGLMDWEVLAYTAA